MSCRLPYRVAVFVILIAGGLSTAQAWQPSRLTMLAAREDLRDQVCVALSIDGGHISREHRFEILGDAKKILSPKEYEAFRQSLDRISVPPPKKDLVAIRAKQQARDAASTSLTRRKAMQLMAKLTPSEGPSIPITATMPDRVASKGMASEAVVR